MKQGSTSGSMEAVGGSEYYSQTTKDIEVTVTPAFTPEQSDPARSVYSFSYTVTLVNKGRQIVQLLNRHWLVFSGMKQIADVKGEGVVGEQPILRAGESYRYTSGTVVVDSFGHMYGTYTFRSEAGEFFDVVIPRFNLLFVSSSVVH